MSWIQGARTRLQLLFARRAAESRIDEEVAFHIEMETERLLREEGLSPAEARRRALVAFGGVTQHKETLREGRGLAWLGGVSLDTRLGFRMLVKYPGLTVVGGLAMAFAIWVGAVTFEMVGLVLHPRLPLPGGENIVQLRNWDAQESTADPRAAWDFRIWSQELTSVTDLGAFRDETRNLVDAAGTVRRIDVAAISSSGFRVASAVPMLGRTLLPEDEIAGAPPVIVMGYDAWRTRFASDSAIVGRSLRLGNSFATVVGVMPEGFAFPVAHDWWVPLHLDPSAQPRTGNGITIFGRLAPGQTLATAQAELSAIGRRNATDTPKTHEQLRPQVRPYAHLFWEPSGLDAKLLFSFNIFAALLLVLLCCNVALLLFARAATRESELIVRSALGASRSRIVVQLVAEALVLGGVSAAVGLGVAAFVLNRYAHDFLELNMEVLPFWYEPHLSLATVVYAIGLTLLGAVIAGALPALKITRSLGTRLREGTAGSGGVRFGGIWTAVIVAQVAVTVAFPAIVFYEQSEARRIETFDVGFRADQYLGVELGLDVSTLAPEDSLAARVRFTAALELLRRQLEAEPGVAGVTFIDRLPRMYHRERYIEVDDSITPPGGRALAGERDARHVAALAAVDPSYFDVLEAPILAGRGFHTGDLTPGARSVIVDQGFVDVVMQGRSPIGRRVRFVNTPRAGDREPIAPEPWFEIVGVAKDLGMGFLAHRDRAVGIYFPAAPASDGVVNMIVHGRGDPLTLTSRIRAIANSADPGLRLGDFQRLDQVADGMLWIIGLWLRITAALTAIALLLSLSGIYAVLAFTVARRTREIGVRVALGASRQVLVAAIFRRPLRQVALGVALGGLLVGVMALGVARGPDATGPLVTAGVISARNVMILLGYVVVMFGVCLLACIVPTRRALAIEPMQALRAD